MSDAPVRHDEDTPMRGVWVAVVIVLGAVLVLGILVLTSGVLES